MSGLKKLHVDNLGREIRNSVPHRHRTRSETEVELRVNQILAFERYAYKDSIHLSRFMRRSASAAQSPDRGTRREPCQRLGFKSKVLIGYVSVYGHRTPAGTFGPLRVVFDSTRVLLRSEITAASVILSSTSANIYATPFPRKNKSVFITCRSRLHFSFV